MDSHFHENDIKSNEIATGSTQVILSAPLAITEELILIIFTYKWGKCVKPVGKYLLESLI
ncbi:MAG: hypothetical protein ABIK21_04860 [bacterium]|nr:hypothetical protein [Actinomycetota bacterium]